MNTATDDTHALLSAYLSSDPEIQRATMMWLYQKGYGYAFRLTHLTNAPDLGQCLTPRVWANVPAFREQLLDWLDQLVDHRPKSGLRAVGGTAVRAAESHPVTCPTMKPAHITAGMDTLKGGFFRIERPEVVQRLRRQFSREKTELTHWTRLDAAKIAAALNEDRRRDTEWDELQRLRVRLAAWFDALETGRAA